MQTPNETYDYVLESLLQLNGTRIIILRSRFVLKNVMDFPVVFRVKLPEKEFVETGPVAEGNGFIKKKK